MQYPKLHSLWSSMGTFFTKYYPFKNFIKSLCHAYELISQQFNQNLNELKFKYSDEKEEHLEFHEKLKNQDLFFLVGVNCKVGNNYEWIDKPKLGEPQGFKLDSSLIDIEKASETILEPKPLEFARCFNRLLFKIPIKDIWVFNSRYRKKSDYNKILDTRSMDEYILLLNAYRFGVTEKLLFEYFTMMSDQPYIKNDNETVIKIENTYIITDKYKYEYNGNLNVQIHKKYNKFHPITNNVSIKNFKSNNYYISSNGVIINNYIYLPVKYNIGKYKHCKFNTKNFIYNKYLNTENIYYIVEVKKISYNINSFLNSIPFWINLNIIIKTNFLNIQSIGIKESVKFSHGVVSFEATSHNASKYYTISKFNSVKFKSAKYNTRTNQKLVKVFKYAY